MEKTSSIYRCIYKKRLVSITLLSFLLIFLSIPIDNIRGEEGSSETQIHTYFCDGINATAYEGATSVIGSFDGDETEFTSGDYAVISKTSDYVYDENTTDGFYQYHRFHFPIVEDISNITQLNITWKGEAGEDLDSYPPKEKINFSFWVKELENSYTKKFDSASIDTFTVSYDSNSVIKRVIAGGVTCVAQSDYNEDFFPSFVRSYYVEVQVTYVQSSEEPSVLDISNPSSVNEGESFDVTINSEGTPVQDAFVEFNDLNYSTNEYGVVTFSAPELTEDTSFDIYVSKDSFVSNSSSIVILNNFSSNPSLVIFSSDAVYEAENFDVIITSDGLPVKDAIVSFDAEDYTTDDDGKVTIDAPLVLSNQSFVIIVSKTGYIGNESTILVLNNDSSLDPEQNLVISCPNSIYESSVLNVTITSDGEAVSYVNIVFNDENFVTDYDGFVSIITPLVNTETDFLIAASKPGFISDSKTISVLDSSETSITLLNPNGGETVSGFVDISWDITNLKDSATISLYYKTVDGSWISIDANLDILDDAFLWDTSSLDDGEYFLKIVLKSDGEIHEDISNSNFTIDNHEEILVGWIYGSVFETVDDDKLPIENSMICLTDASTIEYKSYKCRFTNKSGEYILNNVPAGSYTLSSSKKGYNSQTYENIQIEPGIGTKLNFSLEKVSYTEKNTYNDYLIDQEIKKGSIFGKVDIRYDEDEIFLYDDVNVSILSEDISSKDGLSIMVSGNGTPGTKLVIYLGEIDNPEEILVKYDGSKIEHASDLESFFEIGFNESKYVLATVSDVDTTESIIIVNIPGYSEHIITISSVLESVNIFLMLGIYLLVFLILGIVYISPFFLIRKTK